MGVLISFCFSKKSQKKTFKHIALFGCFSWYDCVWISSSALLGFATVYFFDLLTSLIVFSVCNRVDTKQINCDK